MSVKRIVIPLSVGLLLVLVFLSTIHAEESVSLSAVDSVFLELSGGNISDAAALFAENAVLTNQLTGRSYIGIDEIEEVFAGWHHPDRIYEVVYTSSGSDSVRAVVEVSDQGFIWGQMRLTAEVNNGLIDSLDVIDIRLIMFQMRWRDNGA